MTTRNPRKVKYLIVHCSATKAGQDFRAKDIDAWHKQRGFTSIGYHYVVDLDGKVEPGRAEILPGAHCKGYNYNSIGVCYIGGLDENGTPKDTRTDKQKASLLSLLNDLRKKYPDAVIVGHKDMPNVHKACPCFNAKHEYASI